MPFSILCLPPPRVLYDAVMLNLMLSFSSSGSRGSGLLMHTFLFNNEQFPIKFVMNEKGSYWI